MLEYAVPDRLVAFGDILGDLKALQSALLIAGAVDQSGTWIGGNLVVVQTGDLLLDRGDDEPEELATSLQVQSQARMTGGDVIVMNRNHQIMNAPGDLRYVTNGGCRHYAAQSLRNWKSRTRVDRSIVPVACEDRVRAFGPGSHLAKVFASWPIAALVGDPLFAHGGIEHRYASLQKLQELNRSASRWMLSQAKFPSALNDPPGPVWSRRFADDSATNEGRTLRCSELREVLDAVDASRMVVGHTVQKRGVSAICDRVVWRIDVGMAVYYGGRVEVSVSGLHSLSPEVADDSET